MARAAHDLVVDSVTGVDVSLTIAGTGARSLAFLIDLLIRAGLAGGWFVLATLLYNGEWSLVAPPDPSVAWFLMIALPVALIYLLYHCVLEIAMRGRTPGKRILGVRLVARNGSAPSVAACLVRNVFRLVDLFPLVYGVGLVTCVVTRDHVRVGDLAAGTLLVYENREALAAQHFGLPSRNANIDGATAELIGELLDRWDVLDAGARRRIGRTLLARATNAEVNHDIDDVHLREQLDSLTQTVTTGAPAQAKRS
jgi:uncharacterized RDD family membrane protein YckC